jgi:HptB-dependent secretion and biofilm anti anti-sigma factor
MEYTLATDLCGVALHGELTFSDHQTFRRMAERLFAESAPEIVINLQHLEFIDSSGLGMLLIARDEASKRNRHIILKGAHGQVRKMFDISRFETLFSLDP